MLKAAYSPVSQFMERQRQPLSLAEPFFKFIRFLRYNVQTEGKGYTTVRDKLSSN